MEGALPWPQISGIPMTGSSSPPGAGQDSARRCELPAGMIDDKADTPLSIWMDRNWPAGMARKPEQRFL